MYLEPIWDLLGDSRSEKLRQSKIDKAQTEEEKWGTQAT